MLQYLGQDIIFGSNACMTQPPSCCLCCTFTLAGSSKATTRQVALQASAPLSSALQSAPTLPVPASTPAWVAWDSMALHSAVPCRLTRGSTAAACHCVAEAGQVASFLQLEQVLMQPLAEPQQVSWQPTGLPGPLSSSSKLYRL